MSNYRGAPYVQRHYDINPQSATPTQSATLTLYFTQADFNAYNTAAGIAFPALPTGPADATGIANVRLTQFHGTGTAPGNYTGWTGTGAASVLIDPADNNVVWNSADSRWEVTFPITGFSGFYLHTSNTIAPLPVRLQDFTAALQYNKTVLLRWTMNLQDDVTTYSIERSQDGKTFLPLGSLATTKTKIYAFTDARPFSGNNYYRIRMEAMNGAVTYSEVRVVALETGVATQVYPNPVSDHFVLETNDALLLQTNAELINMEGRLIVRFPVRSAQEQVDVSKLPHGVYLLRLAKGTTYRIVK